jgi:predicted DNA-binding protein
MEITKDKPMSFRISLALVKRLKAKAKKTKTTLTSIVEAALAKYL